MSSFSSLPSFPSVLSLLVGGSSLGWTVRAMGLAATAVVAGAWFRSRSQATKVRSPSCVNATADEAALECASPGTLVLSPLPPVKAGKKKKSVAFALERNETRLVDTWFVDTWGRWERPTRESGTVGFSRDVHVILVARWLQPDGHNQVHFPRTKWIRDVPDWDLEDVDGDVDMLDS